MPPGSTSCPRGCGDERRAPEPCCAQLAQALAPLLFGAVADLIAGFSPPQAPIGTHTHHAVSSATGAGLQASFMIMLITLAAAGIFLLRARRTYPTDVATAAASPWPKQNPTAQTPQRPDAGSPGEAGLSTT